MGTTWSVRAFTPADFDVAGADAAMRAGLDAVIAQMSTWLPSSDISRFNQLDTGGVLAPDKHFATVLRCALEMAQASGGAFDPSIGALVNLWGFGSEGAQPPPTDDAVTTALSFAGWRKLAFSDGGLAQPGGIHLDLSGIAKGYAVDLLASILSERGLNSYLIEIGGELRGVGVKPDAQPWWVDIEEPPGSPHSPIVAALHDLSIASSGDYRRSRDVGGRRIAHTIDPRTGRPLTNDLASVTVLNERCMLADAYATALMVMGPVDGLAFAQARGIAGRFVIRDGSAFREILSPAFVEMLD